MTSGTMLRWKAQTSVSKKNNHALLVDEDDLRYLHSYLSETFGDGIEYRAQRLDGQEVSFKDIEEIISFENPSELRIVEISAKCERSDELSLELVLGSHSEKETLLNKLYFPSETIEYSIYNSEGDDLVKIQSELDQRFKTMRPWYSFLTRLRFFFLVPILFTLYAIALIVQSAVSKMVSDAVEPSPMTYTDNERFALTTLLYGALFLFGAILDGVRVFLFPRVFIAIGRQKENWRKRGIALNVLVVIIGIGLVVSVAGTLIAQGIGWAS